MIREMILTPLKGLSAIVLIGTLLACAGDDDPSSPALTVSASGASTFDADALGTTLGTYPIQSLSGAEADSLAFMREEEELAHAVYARSATLWGTVPIFSNIAASESTHTAAVKALLDRYRLADPLAGLTLGAFKSADFQALYANLIAASEPSLIEALKAGVEIEELDMRDIAAQKLNIDNADILFVYDALLRGSRNHLRSFMTVLQQQGGTYAPKYISQAEFDAIVASPMEKGL